ncbi:MAG: hypothetical protein Kow00106_01800 [Anaerolineae bacterium]
MSGGVWDVTTGRGWRWLTGAAAWLVGGWVFVCSGTAQHVLAQGPDMRYGDTVRGMLDDAHYEERWTFAGQRGDVIRAVMTRAADVPGGLDGYLLLLGPDGDVLAEVDDTGDSVMPTIEGYELPAEGLYTLVATRFGFANGFSTGEYALTLQLVGRQPASRGAGRTGVRWLPTGTWPPGLRWLVYNEPVSGELDAQHSEDWYVFWGRAGDVITLRMAAADGALDSLLIVTDGGGYEVARADDMPDGSYDAVIADLNLPADGVYLVRATRYGFAHGPSAGPYTLIIETDSAPSGPPAASPDPLQPGVPVSGALDLQTVIQRYAFPAQAGQRVTLAVMRTGGTLVPALTLRGSDGSLLARGIAGPVPQEVRIESVTLPADGSYTVEVSLGDLSTSGTYRLLAIVSPPPVPAAESFRPAAELDLEAVLIWSSAADLDLSVTDATGNAGSRDAQANDFCAEARTAPVERVTWAEGSAAPGVYAVAVRYRFDCGGTGAPVQFLLGLAVHGEVTDVLGGTVARPGDTYTTYLVVR